MRRKRRETNEKRTNISMQMLLIYDEKDFKTRNGTIKFRNGSVFKRMRFTYCQKN